MADTYSHINLVCKRHPSLEIIRNSIEDACDIIIDCFSHGGKLLICGNGGSSADSDHFAAELMKSFELKRPLEISLKQRLLELGHQSGKILGQKLEHSLPVISLTSNSALITAISNDTGPEMIFAQQVIGYGNEGDLLVALSTSGNSMNVVNACISARALNLAVIGITGQTGGKIKKFCDVLINVPERTTALIQELHLPVLHTICRIVEEHFYGNKI